MGIAMRPAEYQIYMMQDKEFAQALIKHCDKKIDVFFAKLDKKIEKIVKAEVKRLMKGRKQMTRRVFTPHPPSNLREKMNARFRLMRGCMMKRKFDTEADADRIAKRHDLSIYQCPDCNKFHLTSKKRGSE